jgi:hypothetical protein
MLLHNRLPPAPPESQVARWAGMTTGSSLAGGCAWGAIRFTAHGRPKRAGFCRCLTCRKAHASAFNPFVVYNRDAVEVWGEPRRWVSSPGYERAFCEACGSRVFAENADELELSLGSFDQIGEVSPQFEIWTIRREPWLAPLSAPQHPKDRIA